MSNRSNPDFPELAAPAPLATCLTGEPWWRYTEPFPHFVATNVFVPQVQTALEHALETALSEASAGEPGAPRVHRSDPGFSILPFQESHKALFPVILTLEWHDMLARLLDLDVTGDVDGGIHLHAAGSPPGWVHNDLSPGWFEPGRSVPVNLCDRTRSNYKSGHSYVTEAQPVMRARAATMIYFLGNGKWEAGDGGETGLYDTPTTPVAAPAKRIAPIDNSLLLFTCTPHSWHAFLGKTQGPRRSLIMWLHRDMKEVESRSWGNCLVYWT
jgi:hypothetical protein